MDIEAERRAKEEALSSKQSIQEKSTAFIQEQQTQIEKLHKEKVLHYKYVYTCMFLLSKAKRKRYDTTELR